MIETQDERRARLIAAGKNPDTLQDGEVFRFGLMMADSMSGASTTKDAAVPMTFTDAMPQIHSEFQFKIRHCIGRMNDKDPFIVEQGISDARGIISRMAMQRDGYGAGTGMVTDAAKSALTTCADHLSGIVVATQQRLRARR
ncbi:hypothetical protein [Methylobacterium sp. WL8]|uniref:hypothetical protein n=1 Tax=Methylobacterium sp. WL8 TaxID=2603899 RepID=UPI0011C7564A|nr:hypothetical protein [Methylobacterium sp. WL8]TXN76686.1 hypothetical protein FV234_24465 [Methylobacterium sp. WL8]